MKPIPTTTMWARSRAALAASVALARAHAAAIARLGTHVDTGRGRVSAFCNWVVDSDSEVKFKNSWNL